MAERKKLGRGLSALLGDDGDSLPRPGRAGGAKPVAIELLSPGQFQPRRHMDDTTVEALAQSIADKGVLQPLLVRRHPDDPNGYEIVAGERRWRAAQKAGLHEVPVVIRDLDDRETLEIALVENLQREDLSPIDEAVAYRRLMDEFGHTQEALAKAMGLSRSHVANTLRLLGLPDEIKGLLAERRLGAGHARALIGQPNAVQLARRVVAEGLSVRDVERLAKAPDEAEPPVRRAAAVKDADTRALEVDLTDTLGVRVEIQHGGGGGKLIAHYRSLDQLDDLIGRLGRSGGAAAVKPSRPAKAAKTIKAAKPARIKTPASEQPKLSVSLKPKGTAARRMAPAKRR